MPRPTQQQPAQQQLAEPLPLQPPPSPQAPSNNRLKKTLHLNALLSSLLALAPLLSPTRTARFLHLPTPSLVALPALLLALFAAFLFRSATRPNANAKPALLSVAAVDFFTALVVLVLLLLSRPHTLVSAFLLASISAAFFALAVAHLYFLRLSSHYYAHAQAEIVAI
ncbi:hypothetical protein BWQ96_06449 [Gracilariopsis chorda]|uniref:Uncharacterized protein n=1 Tax=Gracilariopsis chorda TaxID=448386 RepID=A0A2V3IP20_9FLOR|nr:hypothetical protein BWQ96_06449 [Gracilariopsis chorda]|eukprot:PXF43828.1 hypothetical protein BWQ96_06449 [Gracilariopsis chorda]